MLREIFRRYRDILSFYKELIEIGQAVAVIIFVALAMFTVGCLVYKLEYKSRERMYQRSHKMRVENRNLIDRAEKLRYNIRTLKESNASLNEEISEKMKIEDDIRFMKIKDNEVGD